MPLSLRGAPLFCDMINCSSCFLLLPQIIRTCPQLPEVAARLVRGKSQQGIARLHHGTGVHKDFSNDSALEVLDGADIATRNNLSRGNGQFPDRRDACPERCRQQDDAACPQDRALNLDGPRIFKFKRQNKGVRSRAAPSAFSQFESFILLPLALNMVW